MSERVDLRAEITLDLGAFDGRSLPEATKRLFGRLGYASNRRLPISSVEQFTKALDPDEKLTDRDREAMAAIPSLQLLFQLTDAELTVQRDLFDDGTTVETTKIHSYLFFAVELSPGHYTRTALSTLVRAINKPLPMPALVLFRHGTTVSIGIIHRRLHKRDQAKDVLEKVTLIKDIACDDPIRAHLEILNDFALANLDADFGVSNFVRLHEAWQNRLGSYALSNEFYREIADWYFWAHHQVEDGMIRLPQHCDTEQEQSLFLIRLLTRVIFCWFLVEKRLIPSDLFRENWLKPRLKGFEPSREPKKPDASPSYYHAILQNLFFGTLNMPPEQRGFREKKREGQRYDKNYGITNLWRYEADFRNPADWVAISKRIPFLNGGLFDCLDDKTGKKDDNSILDGFSDNPKFTCFLPNDLFFGPERTVDLSHDYGEDDKRTARSKKAKVRGLIEILSRYKFTVEENTPLEEEIALDPELLGKVFENLLASYNEDTKTTARKALGAFYTPREIVSYMVDEALKSYLAGRVPRCKGALEDLFSNKATLRDIKPDTREALITAIGRVKILDPACGSGAFPMGALHRLVDLLQKLDPNNESWKRDRLAEAQRYRQLLEDSGASKEEIADCDDRIADIETSFDTRFHALDFARKLYLIENCIYGVDLQPIATQIAKLRFFISLIVDQKVDPQAPNLGVRPLPNLETRIVAADTLIPIEKEMADLFSADLDKRRAELAAIRHEHFNARSAAAKRKWRNADEAKRGEIAAMLEDSHALSRETARKLASWDPYDQNTFAPFFDSEWMFGKALGASKETETDSGFDIILGNPPYVRQEQIKHLKPSLKSIYESYSGTADLYVFFFEASVKLLRPGGVLALITSNKWYRAAYGTNLRKWILGNCRTLQLIDFGDAPLFTAIAYPSIALFQRKESDTPPDWSFKALAWTPGVDLALFEDVVRREAITMRQKELGAAGWKLQASVNADIRSNMESRCTPLGKFAKELVFNGIKSGHKKAFTLSADELEIMRKRDKNSAQIAKPLLRGRDIKRWAVTSNDNWLLYVTWHFPNGRISSTNPETHFQQSFPEAFRRLKEYEADLKARDQAEVGIRYEWYCLSRPRPEAATFFSEPKIVFPDIAEEPSFAWDDRGFAIENTAYMVVGEKWLLGILNSAPVFWFCRQISNTIRGGFVRFIRQYVEQIPIPDCSPSQRKTLLFFVDALEFMVGSNGRHTIVLSPRDHLMAAYWERTLNGLSYELYFPDELHATGLRLFALIEQAELPNINSIAESKRLAAVREKFEDLYDGNHPLRIALDKLQTLDTVRIIEGKA